MPSESWRTGLRVNLDKVPKKYAGLDGTEIAISESQERMAVVVDPKDVDEFLRYAKEENLEAVRGCSRDRGARVWFWYWRGKEIVNISRAFLDTNGAHQETDVYVEIPSKEGLPSCETGRGSRCQSQMAGYAERSECAAPRRDWWKCSTVPSVQAVF